MPKIEICTTPEQLATLDMLRVRLAEAGYALAPVAETFRRAEADFAAILKRNPKELLIVRPTGNNTVVVRPFACRSLCAGVRALLKDAKRDAAVRIKFGLPQLRFARTRPDWVYQYISPEGRAELAHLGYIPNE